MINTLKEAIRKGNPTVGAGITINSSRVAAVLAHTKFDWIWIDLEHGLIDLETAYELVQATKGTSCVPLVRVPANEDWLIKQALDLGAYGIIVPLVRSAKDVSRAVSASKYPPEGIRGVSSGFAANGWGISVAEYWRICNDELVRIIQVEDLQAIERIEEIMATPGLDMVFIGTGDLSGAVGCIGEPNHPKVEEQIDKVLQASRKLKIPIGIVATNSRDINRRTQQGFTFFLAGTDAAMMIQGAVGALNGVCFK